MALAGWWGGRGESQWQAGQQSPMCWKWPTSIQLKSLGLFVGSSTL